MLEVINVLPLNTCSLGLQTLVNGLSCKKYAKQNRWEKLAGPMKLLGHSHKYAHWKRSSGLFHSVY